MRWPTMSISAGELITRVGPFHSDSSTGWRVATGEAASSLRSRTASLEVRLRISMMPGRRLVEARASHRGRGTSVVGGWSGRLSKRHLKLLEPPLRTRIFMVGLVWGGFHPGAL